MTDEDIHAFTPAGAAASRGPLRAPSRTSRRLWPWLLGASLLVLLLALAGAAVGVAALADAAHQGLHVTINGEPWDPVVIDADHGLLALVGVAGALIIVLLVVPFVLLLALLAAAAGLGIALVAVLAVAAVALSPLWLLALLLWLLLRPGRGRAPAPAARMAA